SLLSLYESTFGASWKNHAGWGGPEGSECEWYGVDCVREKPTGFSRVVSLDLAENRLRGSIPQSMANLKDLESLNLWGNQLTGRLPESLVDRFLAGELQVAAEPSLL